MGRERRCAGEEKEEGLCCWSSKISPESIQLRSQHAAAKVAADLWATDSSADLRFWVCVFGVRDCDFAVLCLMSLGDCRFVQIAADRFR